MKSKDYPHPDYRYWLYDPGDAGTTYYQTAEERNEAAKRALESCIEDGYWDESAEGIYAGEMKFTHKAQVKDKAMRPDDLDEDEVDGEGCHWPEGMEWRGTYTLEPLNAGEPS